MWASIPNHTTTADIGKLAHASLLSGAKKARMYAEVLRTTSDFLRFTNPENVITSRGLGKN